MAAAESLLLAIQVMYGLVPPPTPTAQASAIQWLLQFQETEVRALQTALMRGTCAA